VKHQNGNARLNFVGTLAVIGLGSIVLAVASGGQPNPAPNRLEQTRQSVWPTYHQNVKPIIERHCAGCHTDGGIAPFALDNEKDVTSRAADIARVIKDKSMPPWMAGADSIKFRNERKLSVEERTTIQDWGLGGARPGQPTGATSSASMPAKRRPDMSLGMPKTYVPSSQSQDDYRCFLLDPKLTEDRFVTGYRVNPGEASVVHHVIMYKMEGDNAEKAERLNTQTGGNGWTCFGGPNVPDAPTAGGNWLGAWVPGSNESFTRDGVGIPMPKGTKLVLQMHYNIANGVKPDRTSIDLFMAPVGAKLKPMRTSLMIAPIELPCPPGSQNPLCDRNNALKDNAQRFGQRSAVIPDFLLQGCKKTLGDYQNVRDVSNIPTSCDYTFNQNNGLFGRVFNAPPADGFYLYGVASHMHTKGRASTIELNPGTPQARMILNIPKWDFHWQGNYELETPLIIKPGDTIRLTCRHDNTGGPNPSSDWTSVGPRYVVWGEGTNDEMCLGVLTVGPL
jgi:hypothetical protein